MPSGPKKRRAAKKKKELKEKLKSMEISQDVIGISTSSANSDEEDGSVGGNVGTVALSNLDDESERVTVTIVDKGSQATGDFDPEGCKENEKTTEPEPSLSVKKDSTMSAAQEKRMLLVKDFYAFRTKLQEPNPATEVESAEDADAAALVCVGVTQGTVDEKESEVLVLPSGDESSKNSTKDAAAKMAEKAVASHPDATDVYPLPSKGEETEPSSFSSTVPAEGPDHDEFKVSEDNDVFVLKDDEEESLVPLGAEKALESATSILSDLLNEEICPAFEKALESATSILSDLVNEEICPAFEDNFLEFIEVSNSIRIRGKRNLGFMDGSNTSGDDLFFIGNNSVADSPLAADSKDSSIANMGFNDGSNTSGDDLVFIRNKSVADSPFAADSKDSSIVILVEEGSGFIQKQDDVISLPVVGTGVDKENKVDIQIQGYLNSPSVACPSSGEKMFDGPKGDDEHEVLPATKSTFAADEVHQSSPLLSSSGCILCELVGGQVNHDGKILTTGAQINRVKKMLEEELLATEKLRATLKKLLNDLEAVKNNNDFTLSA